MSTDRVIVSPSLPGGSTIIDPSTLFASGQKGLWIDPSDLTSLFKNTAETLPVTTAGDTVLSVRDKSGNGHKWQAASGGPTYALSGIYPCLRFNGSQMLSTIASVDFTGSDKISAFFAVDRQDASGSRICMYNGYGLGAGGWAFYADTGGTSGASTPVSNGANGYIVCGQGGLGKFLLSSRLDTSQATLADTLDMRLNGGKFNMGAGGGSNPGAGDFGSYTNHLGAYAGVTFPFIGDVFGIVVVQGLLSDAMMVGIENYLKSKMGLV